MKVFQVVVLPQAEADIEAIARWWALNRSFGQVVRWFDVIHEQLNSLAFLPESHSLSPENDDFPFEIRDKLVGLGSRPSYCDVFTIANDTVFVLTVRRGAQDVVSAERPRFFSARLMI